MFSSRTPEPKMQLPPIQPFDKFAARSLWRTAHGERLAPLPCRGKPKLHGASMTLSARQGVDRGSPEVLSALRKGGDPSGPVAPGYAAVREEIESTLWAGRTLAVGMTGIFAEWAGPGVQRKDAVTRIETPKLFVFGAYFVNFGRDLRLADAYAAGEEVDKREVWARTCLVTCPETLDRILNPCPHVEIVPWVTGDLTADGRPEEEMAAVARRANEHVAAYERVDPYILQRFGVSGPGERIVTMPVSEVLNQATLLDFAELS